MSQISMHRAEGVVSSVSGAAVAAIRARALLWEAPCEEHPDRLVISLWGGKVALQAEQGDLRVTLEGVEPRQIGLLQDMVTEVLSEAGLRVAWDRVDAGALAPGLSVMTVLRVSQPSPGFLRVRLQGPDAARFGLNGLHFRLLLPRPGRAPVWPRIVASGRTEWPSGPDSLHRPVYTVAAQAGDWIDFDIFRHANSPTCDWALSRPEGSEVAIIGPGGGWCPEAPRLALFGDETALPAIRRMLALAKGEVSAHLRADPADLGPLAGDARVTRCDDLIGALEASVIPADSHVWFAAGSAEARAARQLLLARGIARSSFDAIAYWDAPDAERPAAPKVKEDRT